MASEQMPERVTCAVTYAYWKELMEHRTDGWTTIDSGRYETQERLTEEEAFERLAALFRASFATPRPWSSASELEALDHGRGGERGDDCGA